MQTAAGGQRPPSFEDMWDRPLFAQFDRHIAARHHVPESYLSAIRERRGEKSTFFVRLDVGVTGDLEWFAARDFLREIGFVENPLCSAAFRLAFSRCGGTVAQEPEQLECATSWRRPSFQTLADSLTDVVGAIGVPMAKKSADHLGWYTSGMLCAGRSRKQHIFETRDRWSDWFGGGFHNRTWVGFDPPLGHVWVVCVADHRL